MKYLRNLVTDIRTAFMQTRYRYAVGAQVANAVTRVRSGNHDGGAFTLKIEGAGYVETFTVAVVRGNAMKDLGMELHAHLN